MEMTVFIALAGYEENSKFAQQSHFVTRLSTIASSNASLALQRGF
tara:strand:+ start:138 stop:272 length:135 start_codon:yes stop_codon:yes gene_type:complete